MDLKVKEILKELQQVGKGYATDITSLLINLIKYEARENSNDNEIIQQAKELIDYMVKQNLIDVGYHVVEGGDSVSGFIWTDTNKIIASITSTGLDKIKQEQRDESYFSNIQSAHFALQSTCQLLRFDDEINQIPTSNGCGVLFEYNDNYYLFSNSHVLVDEQMGKTFILLEDKKIVNIGGSYYHTRLPSSNHRSDDTLDVAVVKLNIEVAKALLNKGLKFLTISDIETNHLLKKQDILLIAGYPASKTRIDFKSNMIINKASIIRTIPSFVNLDALKFPSTFHFIAEYKKKKLRDNKSGLLVTSPDPYGLSGSGLWVQNNESRNNKPILIGILSEYLLTKELVVSTKIDLFIDILRQKFDSTISNYGVQVEIIE